MHSHRCSGGHLRCISTLGSGHLGSIALGTRFCESTLSVLDDSHWVFAWCHQENPFVFFFSLQPKLNKVKTQGRTHSCTNWIRKLIAPCWPRSPSSKSLSLSWFQTALALPFPDKTSARLYLSVILRISSSMQLNTTMHPVKAASSVSASSGRESRSCTKSSLLRITLCMRAMQAVMMVVSEQIVEIDNGASLYLVRMSYRDLPVDSPVAVSLTFHTVSGLVTWLEYNIDCSSMVLAYHDGWDGKRIHGRKGSVLGIIEKWNVSPHLDSLLYVSLAPITYRRLIHGFSCSDDQQSGHLEICFQL